MNLFKAKALLGLEELLLGIVKLPTTAAEKPFLKIDTPYNVVTTALRREQLAALLRSGGAPRVPTPRSLGCRCAQRRGRSTPATGPAAAAPRRRRTAPAGPAPRPAPCPGLAPRPLLCVSTRSGQGETCGCGSAARHGACLVSRILRCSVLLFPALRGCLTHFPHFFSPASVDDAPLGVPRRSLPPLRSTTPRGGRRGREAELKAA